MAAMRPRDKRELADRNQQMAAMYAEGKTLREIAAHFQVSVVRVQSIVHRERKRTEFASVQLITH